MKKQKEQRLLRPETKIEVVAIKNGKAISKKEMTILEWESLSRKQGFKYYAYQKGFSQYNIK